MYIVAVGGVWRQRFKLPLIKMWLLCGSPPRTEVEWLVSSRRAHGLVVAKERNLKIICVRIIGYGMQPAIPPTQVTTQRPRPAGL